MVSEIRPISFCNIYDNFPDTTIEKSDCDFNTSGILETINKNNIKRIIVNFKSNEKTIPKITSQIEKLKSNTRVDFVFARSTSGAAGNNYEQLISEWTEYFT